MTDTNQATNQQAFSIINIFTKDISVETPNSPHIFSAEWNPKVDFDLQMSNENLGDNMYESVLHVTVTTSIPMQNKDKKEEQKTAFLVETKQAGIFNIAGFSEDDIEHILATTTQEILFPYARELISNLVTKAGFPQMLLPPVNFNALYQEHKAKEKSKATTE